MKIVVLGAGGHGRVVAQCIMACAQLDKSWYFAGYIDPSMKPGSRIGENEVLGNDETIPALVADKAVSHFIVGVGTTRGGTEIRRKIYNAAIKSGLKPISVVHPSAVIAPDVAIKDGSVVMPGAVINTGAHIGENVIINTRASIDHDCVLSDDVHIAPGCVLSGNVTVGTGSLIGVGSCVVQGIDIGTNVTAGAGTVIISDVAEGLTVVGTPQRTISES